MISHCLIILIIYDTVDQTIMGQPYKLSILDKCPQSEQATAEATFQHTLQLVQVAEQLGFHRYWIAEHHATPQLASPSPEIIIAWLLGQTKRIRIGSGGVMLQHYSAYKVAENFNILASLATGRVDLGIGKAPGGFPVSTQALQLGTDLKKKGTFSEQLTRLTQYLQPQNIPKVGEIIATPVPKVAAERFLLGASDESAELAAKLDWNFVFAAHLNGDPERLKSALELYFNASQGRKALVAVQVVIGDTRAEAQQAVSQLTVWTLELDNGQRVKVPSEDSAIEFARQAKAKIVGLKQEQLNILAGTAADIQAQLHNLHTQYGIDEFVVEFPLSNHEKRLQSLIAIANRLALAG
ncbi:luciferase family oxidoreductase, group 1 [Acinetobacter apis]|uniref:Luciferase family oxidoreductase, group 1 n=2 Tax=Acinetobacter apis TaxID=1229165 RepID=A0A217EG06_9GAMM|nr:luciferase family oxidoreductase, group 1 [Acinetobacter apis]